MVATDERTYALRSCDGTVDIDAARLVIQGAPHATGRTRRPVVIERDEVDRLIVRFGLLGGSVTRVLPSGYRSLVVRTRTPGALWDDLRHHGWPVVARGLRRPR